MAKIVFTLEDTDTGLVSVVAEVADADKPSNALRMATDVGCYIDVLASKVFGDSLARNEPVVPKILLPNGAMRH